MNSQAYVILSVLTALSAGHVYNGPSALLRSATEVSVNGLAPASFVVEGKEALVEALADFVGAA